MSRPRCPSPFEDKQPLTHYSFNQGKFTWFYSKEEGTLLEFSDENFVLFHVQISSSEVLIKSIPIKILIAYVRNPHFHVYSISRQLNFKARPDFSIIFSQDFETATLRAGSQEVSLDKTGTQGIWDWLSEISSTTDRVNLF